jgi:hypothetical protein
MNLSATPGRQNYQKAKQSVRANCDFCWYLHRGQSQPVCSRLVRSRADRIAEGGIATGSTATNNSARGRSATDRSATDRIVVSEVNETFSQADEKQKVLKNVLDVGFEDAFREALFCELADEASSFPLGKPRAVLLSHRV